MKKTELTATLSRTVNKVGLQIKKRSPEILIVAGVVGTVTSAVMACKATLKVDEIMRESNDTIEKVHKARSMDGQPSPSNPEKVIAQYRFVSIFDLYELAGLDAPYTYDKYGWSDISTARVLSVREGYLIKLPRPVPVD